MSWCWFALLDGATAVEGELARAGAYDVDGTSVGTLAAWPAGGKPVASALRMDDRLVDADGEAAWVSLVLLARDRSPLFDDPAISGALRRVLAETPPDGVSTLVRDSSHFAGAVTVRRGWPAKLRDDPFARIGHAEVLLVDKGLFGRTAPVPGPVIQRYSGKPWPAAGF